MGALIEISDVTKRYEGAKEAAVNAVNLHEYRRLADLAITAQEHTDLKLADLSVHMEFLRSQNEALQSILKEVE